MKYLVISIQRSVMQIKSVVSKEFLAEAMDLARAWERADGMRAAGSGVAYEKNNIVVWDVVQDKPFYEYEPGISKEV